MSASRRSSRSGDAEPKAPPRHERLVIPDALPKRPDENSFAFARTSEVLKHLSLGQLVLIIEEQPEYQLHVLAKCEAAEVEDSRMSASRRLYTYQEAMRVELLRVLRGDEMVEDTCEWLAGNRGSGTRRLLGFDRPRDHVKNRYRPHQVDRGDDKWVDGVPSEPTIRRYKQKLGIGELATVAERAFEDIVPANLKEFPEMRQAARIEFNDGTGIRTHYTAPHYRKQKDGTKKLINAHRVTAPEAGSTGNAKLADKNGDGWWLNNRTICSGEVISYALTKWHEPENKTAEEIVLEQFRRIAYPHLGLQPGELIVESDDNAFHSHSYRRKLKEFRIVANIHLASHGGSDTTKKNVEAMDRAAIPLEGTNWHVNGHLEPFCACGGGVVERHYAEKSGVAREWTEGRCENCGHLNLTPGRWRRVKNPARYVKAQPGEKADWALGAPMTYHSKLSKYYGKARMAYQEGAHGVLANGSALLRHKRWFDETVEVRLETALVYFIQHALSRWVRREAARRDAGRPPNLRLATWTRQNPRSAPSNTSTAKSWCSDSTAARSTTAGTGP